MNMITRISPDAGTPLRALSNNETQADHNGLDELIVLRMSELRVTNRRAIAGQLSASIAHEINQPLAAIALSGSAALRWLSLKNPDLNEVRSCLEDMVADSHRAAQIVDAVRAMYKKDVQSKTIVDLGGLVAETLDLLRTEIVKHDVTVRKIEAEMLPRVCADRVQLQQVLINLIKNAIDAMSSVNNRSRILSIQIELNRAKVIISVGDSGAGLAPSDVDNIFTPFFTTKPQGMGVGLSLDSISHRRNDPILGDPGMAASLWKEIVEIADKHNAPGKFTTFPGFEWTSNPDWRNLHRVVVFKDSTKVPERAFSAIDSDVPEDLWAWMDKQREQGSALVAVPHNGNASDGLMFPVEKSYGGSEIGAAYAKARMRNEPLYELTQIKGTSVTCPSFLGPSVVRK